MENDLNVVTEAPCPHEAVLVDEGLDPGCCPMGDLVISRER